MEQEFAPDDPKRLLPEDTAARWDELTGEERANAFRALPRPQAEDFFLSMDAPHQASIILALPAQERRLWMRALAPDDAADVIQEAPDEDRPSLLSLLDDITRMEVGVLLAYAEDDAGGLMSPAFARVRPDMTADEAISYLRLQARSRVETIHDAYVLDAQQRLLGVVGFRELFSASPDRKVQDLMIKDVISVPDTMDQEQVSQVFHRHRNLFAIPVVDEERHMKGIVTLDDIVDVMEEETTEDIQKYGGMEALEKPYLEAGFFNMVRARAGWLAALFLGEMLTTAAMSHFEDEIARAVVLAIFIPLIISSGGNSGSQASTLVVRALALNEVRLRDWWRVARRELASGALLGAILGTIGLLRVGLWEQLFGAYGQHWFGIGLTVAISLMGVVLFGTVAGSMLPLLLRRAGFDPASASAPFVATLVDVSGLIIYFTAARLILGGALL